MSGAFARSTPIWLLSARTSNFLAESLLDVGLIVATLEITNSATTTALISLCVRVPAWIWPLVGGFVTDSISSRSIVYAANAAVAIASASMGAAMATDQASLFLIAVCAASISSARAFEGPALFAQMSENVPPEKLQRLNSLIEISKRGSRIVAPLLVGLSQVHFGVAGVFLQISALALAALLTSVRFYASAGFSTPTRRQMGPADLRQALAELQGNRKLFFALLVDVAFTFGHQAVYWVALPKFLTETSHAWLSYPIAVTALSSGALLGGLLGWFAEKIDRLALVYWAEIFGILAIAVTPVFISCPAAMLTCVAASGLAMSLQRVSLDTFIQSLVPAGVLGRCYAIWRMSVELVGSVAILSSGLVADSLGPVFCFAAFPIASIAFMTLFFNRAR